MFSNVLLYTCPNLTWYSVAYHFWLGCWVLQPGIPWSWHRPPPVLHRNCQEKKFVGHFSTGYCVQIHCKSKSNNFPVPCPLTAEDADWNHQICLNLYIQLLTPTDNLALRFRTPRVLKTKPIHCRLNLIICDWELFGQIIIFHQPRFPWNKGNSLTKPPFGVRSCEVAIIWPELWFFVWEAEEVDSRPSNLFCRSCRSTCFSVSASNLPGFHSNSPNSPQLLLLKLQQELGDGLWLQAFHWATHQVQDWEYYLRIFYKNGYPPGN